MEQKPALTYAIENIEPRSDGCSSCVPQAPHQGAGRQNASPVITAEQISDEVAKAARLAWLRGPKDPTEAFRHAIATALNVWAGAEQPEVENAPAFIILPLP